MAAPESPQAGSSTPSSDQQPETTATKKTSAKRGSRAQKPSAKKATARKSTAKKSTAKNSTAKNSTGKNSTGKNSTADKPPEESTSADSEVDDTQSADDRPDAATNPFGLPFTLGGPPPDLTALGDFIRSQRERAELSVRRLAELADVSNPYLSQVERGLRKPSADILQQVANALRISVESLYVRAGILPDNERQVSTIPEAIDHDPNLTDDQKRALRGVYDSFVAGS